MSARLWHYIVIRNYKYTLSWIRLTQLSQVGGVIAIACDKKNIRFGFSIQNYVSIEFAMDKNFLRHEHHPVHKESFLLYNIQPRISHTIEGSPS